MNKSIYRVHLILASIQSILMIHGTVGSLSAPFHLLRLGSMMIYLSLFISTFPFLLPSPTLFTGYTQVPLICREIRTVRLKESRASQVNFLRLYLKVQAEPEHLRQAWNNFLPLYLSFYFTCSFILLQF